MAKKYRIQNRQLVFNEATMTSDLTASVECNGIVYQVNKSGVLREGLTVAEVNILIIESVEAQIEHQQALADKREVLKSTLESMDIPREAEVAGPELEASPLSLNFAKTVSNKKLKIANKGDVPLKWLVSSATPWIRNSNNGVDDGEITVVVERGDMASGSYEGSLSVVSNGGSQNVPVTMTVD